MQRPLNKRLIGLVIMLIMVINVFGFSVSSKADGEVQSRLGNEEPQEYTDEEKAFIESYGTVRIAYSADFRPVAYEEDGELSGISREIFNEIERVSGLDFEYIPLPEGTIKYDYLQEKDYDLIAGVEYNEENLNVDGLYLSTPYLTSKRVLVCSEDFVYDADTSYSMAIPTGSVTLKKVVQEEYPDYELVDYDTVAEGLQAVHKEKQDLLLLNQYVAEYWLAKPIYHGMTVIPVEGMEDILCFSAVIDIDGDGGIAVSDAEMIINIINKSLTMISDDDMEGIIIKSTMDEHYDYSWLDFIYMFRYTIVIVAVLVIALLITFLVMGNLKKKHLEIRAREEKISSIQQKKYKMIIDNSSELIYEISLDGETCIASEGIKEKFGWEIPKVVDILSINSLCEILHVHPDDQEQFYSSTEGLVANKEVKEVIIRLGRVDGVYLWCNVIYMPVLDDDKNMVSIVGKILDVDATMKEKKLLELQSRTDGLTGLLNKTTFEEETRAYIEDNTAVSSAFIFIDMDFFKSVNDMLGHVMGDQVIKDTAIKLQVIFANCDLVSRFGGDEYCIFVKDIPSETLADKLNFAIDKLSDIYTNNGVRVKLTASIGAAYCSSPSVGYDQLLKTADEAVYRAKNNGRNQYIITYL